jgi:hypothetical protein
LRVVVFVVAGGGPAPTPTAAHLVATGLIGKVEVSKLHPNRGVDPDDR